MYICVYIGLWRVQIWENPISGQFFSCFFGPLTPPNTFDQGYLGLFSPPGVVWHISNQQKVWCHILKLIWKELLGKAHFEIGSNQLFWQFPRHKRPPWPDRTFSTWHIYIYICIYIIYIYYILYILYFIYIHYICILVYQLVQRLYWVRYNAIFTMRLRIVSDILVTQHLFTQWESGTMPQA